MVCSPHVLLPGTWKYHYSTLTYIHLQLITKFHMRTMMTWWVCHVWLCNTSPTLLSSHIYRKYTDMNDLYFCTNSLLCESMWIPQWPRLLAHLKHHTLSWINQCVSVTTGIHLENFCGAVCGHKLSRSSSTYTELWFPKWYFYNYIIWLCSTMGNPYNYTECYRTLR